MRPKKGDQLELTIDSLAYGGAGVARRDRYVVFVAGGLPGDRVLAEVGKAKSRFAEARIVELLEPSPDRVPERAPHPGASWQCLKYERQLVEKQQQVYDSLQRLGGFEQPPVEEIVPADEDHRWNYRNKVEYSFGAGEDGKLALGYHLPGRWDVIEDVDDVVLASQNANEVRRLVRDWCDDAGLTPYDRREKNGFLRNLFVREGRRTGHTMVRLVTTAGEFADGEFGAFAHEFATSTIWTQTEDRGDAAANGTSKTLAGIPFIEEELCGLRFRISPDAFFQTNTEQAEKLYGVAREFADLHGHERVFDLYCGSGTIGLSMAVRAAGIWGIEINETAVKDAKTNARINEIDNAQFVAGDMRLALPELLGKVGKPDVVVVDPPRAGMSQKVVRRILEAEAKRIVYVSCNPSTLAPNLRQMVDAGYELKRVRPVDMFPHTPHIEAVAVLDRVS